jgi:hypothetical protein
VSVNLLSSRLPPALWRHPTVLMRRL